MWYLLCSCGYRLHIVQPQAFPIIKKHTHGVTHSNVMKTTAGLRIVRWFTRQMTVENYHAERFEGVILVLCLMRQRSRLLLIWDWTFHKHHLIEHVRLSMNWSLRLWGTCIREWGYRMTERRLSHSVTTIPWAMYQRGPVFSGWAYTLDRYVLCNYQTSSEHAIISRCCTINYGGGGANTFKERPWQRECRVSRFTSTWLIFPALQQRRVLSKTRTFWHGLQWVCPSMGECV